MSYALRNIMMDAFNYFNRIPAPSDYPLASTQSPAQQNDNLMKKSP